MNTAVLLRRRKSNSGLSSALVASARLWFATAVVGQWMLALYVAGFFGVAAAYGNWLYWNKVLPHGYEVGNTGGNAILGAHLLFAFVIMVLGPLQFVPAIRARIPAVHRWSGRVYVLLAFVMGMTGLYLILSGRKVAGDPYLSLAINAVLIMICAAMTARFAIARRFDAHQRWALRLFLVVNGVWFFRVGLMLWLVVNRGPVGFDPDTFQGPFLTVLGFSQYLLPLAILELYLFARDRGNALTQVSTTVSLLVLTVAMGIGIFGAILGLWVPQLGR